jgi:hypothetical protein
VEQAAEVASFCFEFWVRNGPAGGLFAAGQCRAADGKVALLIASSQARTTTSSVFDADTGWGASIPLFLLRKTLEGWIGVDFAPFSQCRVATPIRTEQLFLTEKLRQQLLQALPLCENGLGRISEPHGGWGSYLRVCLRGAGANVGKGGRMVEGVEDWGPRAAPANG